MSTNSPLSKPPPAPPAKDQPGKRAAILIVGALVALTMAYLSGWRMSTRPLREANQELARMRTRAEAAEGDVARREVVIRQLEARRQLHLTLMALDQRNFGTAQSHLSAAAGLLAEGGAAKNEPTAALAQQIRGTELVVASDFAEQRDRVLDFARQLDGALGDQVPQAPGASPAP